MGEYICKETNKGFIFKVYKQPMNLNIKTIKKWAGGFPGGPVVKNPPANAADMGSVPGQGPSHHEATKSVGHNY